MKQPTAKQTRVLLLIHANPSISLRELGDKLGVTFKAAHDHTEALIKKGFMYSPAGRKRHYVLTPTGKAHIDTLACAGPQIYRKIDRNVPGVA